jgi:GNAT superfamily N-acetyltransferase
MKLKTLHEGLQPIKNIIYQDDIGYIKGYLKPNGYWFIETFYINPEFRGKGLAKDLAKHIPQKAELLAQPLIVKGQQGLDRQLLINFYKSIGFKKFPDSNDNMIMRRD